MPFCWSNKTIRPIGMPRSNKLSESSKGERDDVRAAAFLRTAFLRGIPEDEVSDPSLTLCVAGWGSLPRKSASIL